MSLLEVLGIEVRVRFWAWGDLGEKTRVVIGGFVQGLASVFWLG